MYSPEHSFVLSILSNEKQKTVGDMVTYLIISSHKPLAGFVYDVIDTDCCHRKAVFTVVLFRDYQMLIFSK